jgi:hypothetical protein
VISSGIRYDSPVALFRELVRDGDCLVWPGWRNRNGSGNGLVLYQGQRLTAARAAYLMLYGALPDGVVVAHTCRNEGCCNPAHLSVETPATRSRRMSADNRWGDALLAADQVREAWALAWAGAPYPEIAAHFGLRVGRRLGHSLRKRCRTLGLPPLPSRECRKLTPTEAAQIREQRLDGASLQTVADRFGVAISTVSKIARGLHWGAPRPRRPHGKLDAAAVRRLVAFVKSGASNAAAGRAFGISPQHAGRLVRQNARRSA